VNIFVSPSRDEMGKFLGVVRAFPEIWDGLVLDVGCRSGNLKGALLNRKVHYWGLDLLPPADVIGDIEVGLPFGKVTFDTVVALDVLEHTDNIYQAFRELCRVARQYVVIGLPNVYELKSRIKFLLGQRLSGKYGLPLDSPDDRHRWLFSLQEARAFTHTIGQRQGFEVCAEGSFVGPRRGSTGARFIVSLVPNLLSPWYIVLLHRREAVEPWR
jgi:SAM-dependent methyltransferase